MPTPIIPSDEGPTALPVPPAPVIDNFRALVWILISVVSASLMTIAVRQVSLEIDSRMIVLLRAGITTLLILAALVVASPLRRQMRFSRPVLHLFRGTLIGLSTHLGFYTISNIPLATATVLFFMAPIFATIFASLIHGEKVGPRRWSAVSAGFIGAVIILRPGFSEFHPAMLTAIGSSFLFALALTLSRNLARADGVLSTYFSSVVITTIITLPIAMPVYALPTDWITWAATAALVITGAIRGYADTAAYHHGDASLLAPVTYLRLVLISLGGYLLFGETPDAATFAGAAIIIAATLYIAQRENKLRKMKN